MADANVKKALVFIAVLMLVLTLGIAVAWQAGFLATTTGTALI